VSSVPTVELGFRSAAVRVGFWLGWASILVVLAGLALDVGTHHRLLLIALTLAAAAANAAAMRVPWREWLPTLRGQVLLDLWSGGLIAFVALLVVSGGSNFALLLFFAIPFIAVVQTGWRRGFWLAVSAATCASAAGLVPLSAGATAMRLVLVGAAVCVALALTQTIRHERTLAKEASHRIKNDLQTAADLLLLGRPDAIEETAARIRSIATVHRLLTESGNDLDGGALLRAIAESAPVPVSVDAEPVDLDPATAQKLGLVANELITNAFRHGALPIAVQLRPGVLRVVDGGAGIDGTPGFGLELVRRIVEQGLGGTFELSGTRAEVVFPR
jgi:two-component sensor histidine kinase